jgi:hypothetical protein
MQCFSTKVLGILIRVAKGKNTPINQVLGACQFCQILDENLNTNPIFLLDSQGLNDDEVFALALAWMDQTAQE